MNKKRISIIGLPRSGTTILANILNSLDDTVCLSEPLWTFFKYDRLRNVGKVDFSNHSKEYSDFLPSIYEIFKKSEYTNLCIKETCTSWHQESIEIIDETFPTDYTIFIIRDPKTTYSSWKNMKWTYGAPVFASGRNANIKYFINSFAMFNSYMDSVIKSNKNALILEYEKLASEDGLTYLKEKLSGVFNVPLDLRLKKIENGIGDAKARVSTHIDKHRIECDNLTNSESIRCEQLLKDYACYYGHYRLNHCDEVVHRTEESEESEENTVHNMASCMLSILDSIKLHDNGYGYDGETLSEMMFRKMRAYNVDLNKELGFDHLKPVDSKKNKSKSKKEKLILKVINDGKKGLKKTQKNHEEMIKEYQENGFGDMHPNNIEGYKTGLSYTLGYTFGHLELLKQVNKLIKMSPKEIKDLIAENKRIEKKNKKHLKDVFNRIKKHKP